MRATPRAVMRLLRGTMSGRRLEFLLRRWRAGQRRRREIPDDCRPNNTGAPALPPYRTGPALEEYFFAYARGRMFAREYIPVFWTAAYRLGQAPAIQRSAPVAEPAPAGTSPSASMTKRLRRSCPPETLVFSAGGLYQGPGHVPIPLVCSRIRDPIEVKPKDVLCSFVGSLTHRIRKETWDAHQADPEFRFVVFDHWTPRGVAGPARAVCSLELTERSRYTLCPRGFGPTSFRLYEAMQFGSVPVYVSDHHHLPWTEEIDWNEIAVLVRPEEIPHLGERLRAIDEASYQRILANIRRVYDEYFSLAGVMPSDRKTRGLMGGGPRPRGMSPRRCPGPGRSGHRRIPWGLGPGVARALFFAGAARWLQSFGAPFDGVAGTA